MEFYRAEPTARTSWRLAILMGANARTYKFALGQALLHLASQGRDTATLDELAVPYTQALLARADGFPQAPASTALGPADFLKVLAEEAAPSRAAGHPTDRLLRAATVSMPGMVMQKFHNLRGTTGVPHEFYRLHGRGPARVVELTSDLHTLARQQTSAVLTDELDARWSLVEASFDAGIGRSLMATGVLVDPTGTQLLDRIRRAPVAPARSALVGFQHGRCFHCHIPLDTTTWVDVHVDHLFPYAAMTTGSWRGPDLNGIWNLVVSCATCNLAKSTRLPTPDELARLAARNEAILGSPHPLRRTILRQITAHRGGSTASDRWAFYQAVDHYIREGGAFRSARPGASREL